MIIFFISIFRTNSAELLSLCENNPLYRYRIVSGAIIHPSIKKRGKDMDLFVLAKNVCTLTLRPFLWKHIPFFSMIWGSKLKNHSHLCEMFPASQSRGQLGFCGLLFPHLELTVEEPTE